MRLYPVVRYLGLLAIIGVVINLTASATPVTTLEVIQPKGFVEVPVGQQWKQGSVTGSPDFIQVFYIPRGETIRKPSVAVARIQLRNVKSDMSAILNKVVGQMPLRWKQVTPDAIYYCSESGKGRFELGLIRVNSAAAVVDGYLLTSPQAYSPETLKQEDFLAVIRDWIPGVDSDIAMGLSRDEPKDEARVEAQEYAAMSDLLMSQGRVRDALRYLELASTLDSSNAEWHLRQVALSLQVFIHGNGGKATARECNVMLSAGTDALNLLDRQLESGEWQTATKRKLLHSLATDISESLGTVVKLDAQLRQQRAAKQTPGYGTLSNPEK